MSQVGGNPLGNEEVAVLQGWNIFPSSCLCLCTSVFFRAFNKNSVHIFLNKFVFLSSPTTFHTCPEAKQQAFSKEQDHTLNKNGVSTALLKHPYFAGTTFSDKSTAMLTCKMTKHTTPS